MKENFTTSKRKRYSYGKNDQYTSMVKAIEDLSRKGHTKEELEEFIDEN